jgi:hypothetical protein
VELANYKAEDGAVLLKPLPCLLENVLIRLATGSGTNGARYGSP